MADATPSNYIIGVIIFILIVVSGISIISEFRSVDDTFLSDDEFNEINNTFDKRNELIGNITSMKADIETGESNINEYGVIGALIENAWGTIRLLGQSFNFMNVIINGLTKFYVPEWITGLLSLFITVIIIFSIYSLIFQVRT